MLAVRMRFGYTYTPPITSNLPLGAASHGGRPEAGNANAVLVGLPAYYIVRRLQSVLNATARLIYRIRMRSADHITDALAMPAFTGCASRSGSITRSLCRRISFTRKCADH